MTLSMILLCILVIFVSSLVRSTLGFGDALVAMAILSPLVGLKIATPLIGLTGLWVGFQIVLSDWKNIHFQPALKMLGGALLGVPVGIFFLKNLSEKTGLLSLGVTIFVVSLYMLFRPQITKITSPVWQYVFGFLAGMLGGAYNTGGPPTVMCATLYEWPPEKFRATLQGYFFPSGLFIASSHGVAGMWTREIFFLVALSIPLMILAVWLGKRLNSRIRPQAFEKIIYISLIFIGLMLIYQNREPFLHFFTLSF